MAVPITRWKCEHCKKHFATERYTTLHERKCFFSRDNKACPTCIHFNGCYNVYAKCYKNGRELRDKENSVFTEFLAYNCPDWDEGITEDMEA
jgi:hypothetical protein